MVLCDSNLERGDIRGEDVLFGLGISRLGRGRTHAG